METRLVNNNQVMAMPVAKRHLIELNKVSKAYDVAAGKFLALKEVDMQADAGEFVAVVGKSGSGKSTLINMITGIDTPTSGEVVVAGTAVHLMDQEQLAVWRGRNAGVVFQFFQLLPTLTVAENGDQGGAGAVIGACVAGSAWGGGQAAGPWESKPNAACETGSVQGVRSADGTSWSFGLAPLVVANEVNVVITPGTVAPGAPVGSSFSLAFNPPSTSALATTPGSGSGGGGLALDPATDLVSDPVGALDIGTLFSADVVSPFTPALPTSAQGLTPTAPVVRQSTAANVLPARAPAKNGAVAFFVLLGCLAVLVRLNRIPVPNLRLLGPLGSSPATAAATIAAQPADTGGLGRFARRRVGTPPPLV